MAQDAWLAQASQRRRPAWLAECELANHPRVDQHMTVLQKRGEFWVADLQMIDPDRGVDQDHAGAVCRLGIAFTSGSLPAS